MTDTAAPPVDRAAEGLHRAQHQDGLRLLEEAEITGSRVPPSFDGAVLVQEIERLKLHSDLVRAVENPPATSEQREAAGVILRQAKELARALRGANADPVVARSFADGEGPLPLHSLVELLDRLSATKPRAAARLGGLSKATPTTAPAPMPREDGPTFNDEMLGDKLPALYQRLFSCTPTFAPSEPSGGGAVQHTECVRFVAVVASRCLNRTVTTSAVTEARKRWRRGQGQSVPAETPLTL